MPEYLLFRSWAQRIERKIRAKAPNAQHLYLVSRTARRPLDELRSSLGVAAPAAESRIVAFYMGAIEGNARECLDKSQMYTQKLYDLVMSVVVYPEIIEGRIINEAAIEPAAYHCPPNLFR